MANSKSGPSTTASLPKDEPRPGPADVTNAAVSGLGDVIVTELLHRRPSRPPDHAAESRALLELASVLGDAPLTVLQTLVDAALDLTGADSAGISVLENVGDKRVFRWRATAGAFFPFAQGTLPRDFSPCGVVIDRNAPQLMCDPVRFYPYIAELNPQVSEVLLVPFHRNKTPIGTVWVVAHTDAKHFDAEDERLITSLSKFAAAAVQVIANVEALQASATTLAAVVEQAPAFICTLRGPQHVFELANERYYEIVGKRDIIGKSIRDALPEVEGQGFFELLDNVYRTGETFAGNEMPVLLRRMGDESLDRRFMNLVYQPTREANGSVSGIFVHGVDVTDLVLAREAARAGEARLRQMADAMPQIVWVTRGDGYHDYYNRRWYEFTGMPEGSTDGEGWNEMFHPDDRERAWATWRRSLTTGEPYEIEYRLRHHTGEYRWTLGRALPIRNEQGEIERWFGTCTDIDMIKRWQQEREHLLGSERTARAEAERAGRMKDEFLATLSHELRTPLAAMLLWSKLLRNGTVRGAAAQAQALEAIEVSAESQKQLIEDLLDISRMTSGKLALSLQEVELEGLVHAAVEAVRPMAEAKGVEVELAFGRRLGRVRVDPDRARQVVWNLVNNAVKFTDAGGEVRVRLRRLADAIQIQVRDTGRGITAEFLPHVFERFRQQDGSTTRAVGGLGLGLSIARQIVELHGGTIRAESDGPGEGATFTVELRLPVTAATVSTPDSSDDAAAAAEPVMRSPVSLGGTRVLFVEDDAATRAAIECLLRDAGAEVTAVGSAAAAVAAFRGGTAAHSYDVLLSDIGLPERNGYELIRDVREMEALAGEGRRRVTPAIALTAYARPQDREQALAAGFQTHLAKPVEPTALLEAVAALVGRKGGAS